MDAVRSALISRGYRSLRAWARGTRKGDRPFTYSAVRMTIYRWGCTGRLPAGGVGSAIVERLQRDLGADIAGIWPEAPARRDMDVAA